MNWALKNLPTSWLGRALSFTLLAGLGLNLWAADSVNEATEVRLIPAKDGISVSIGGSQNLKLDQLPNGATINEVWLQAQGSMVVVGGVRKTVNLSVAGFPGLTARIGTGDRATWSVSTEKQLIDFSTSTNNAAPVELAFVDGGKAQMGAGSSARFDLFKDGSYYLSGRGKVSSVDADGLKRDLSQFLPPMSGGPLVRVSDGKKGTRMKRLNPLVEVALGGKYGETMQIYVGPRKVLLTPTAPQTVELPNGTRVVLSQDPKTQSLAWAVEKGFCRFWVSGFDCWSAFALTDQSANQVWDTAQGAVDISNHTLTNSPAPVRELLVRIANKFSASVPPATTFQYVNVQNCTTYIAASDGNVEIYNPDNKQITSVAGGLKTFRGGAATSLLNTPINAISMNWEDGNELQVSGTPGDFKVAPRTRQTLRGENSSQVDVDYGQSGQIDIKAISSDYALTLAPLKDWLIGIREGDGLTMQFDWKSGIFIATANPGNVGSVSFSSSEGYAPQVNPGGVITILGGTFGSLLSRMQGSSVFYEGGGVGGGAGFGASFGDNFLVPPLVPGLRNPDFNDPTRIPQPGASVVGK